MCQAAREEQPPTRELPTRSADGLCAGSRKCSAAACPDPRYIRFGLVAALLHVSPISGEFKQNALVSQCDRVDAVRRGDVIMSHNDIPVQPLLLNITQTASFVPEGGQSLATAHQEAIHRLAEQIVGQMELPW